MLSRHGMHLRAAFVLASLSIVACSRHNEPTQAATPPAPAPVVSATPAPSVSASVAVAVAPSLPAPPSNPTRPALLKRVTPKKITASSFLKEKGNWVGQLAVDKQHTTAWQPAPGTDAPWIEATFDKPVKLWGIRTDAGWVNSAQWAKTARPKAIKLRLDDKDVYQLDVAKEAAAADFLGIDQSASTVRLTYSDLWPGPEGAPLAVSELSFWIDASDAPSVPRKTVEEELAAISGDDAVAKAKAVLLRFGVVPKGEADTATATLHPLTDDILVLEVVLGRKEGAYAAYVFVGEVERDGMKRLFGLDSEVIDAPGADDPKMEITRVHDEHDVALTWSIVRDGKPTQHGLRVLSLARGAVEKIADFLDERVPHVDTESAKEGGVFDIVLEPSGNKPRWRNRFDDRAYWYW